MGEGGFESTNEELKVVKHTERAGSDLQVKERKEAIATEKR